jgi:protein required for attachment to host cells
MRLATVVYKTKEIVMKLACITIVDASRARIFTYDATSDAGAITDGRLREVIDLVNPGRRGHDLFSTSKPGTRHSPGGTRGSTTDDHRDGHFEELEQRFAKIVLEEVSRITGERGIGAAIIVAGPKMLGALRAHDSKLRDLTIEYVERDIAQLSSPQIHDHLAQLDLIAPRPRPVFAAR